MGGRGGCTAEITREMYSTLRSGEPSRQECMQITRGNYNAKEKLRRENVATLCFLLFVEGMLEVVIEMAEEGEGPSGGSLI